MTTVTSSDKQECSKEHLSPAGLSNTKCLMARQWGRCLRRWPQVTANIFIFCCCSFPQTLSWKWHQWQDNTFTLFLQFTRKMYKTDYKKAFTFHTFVVLSFLNTEYPVSTWQSSIPLQSSQWSHAKFWHNSYYLHTWYDLCTTCAGIWTCTYIFIYFCILLQWF